MLDLEQSNPLTRWVLKVSLALLLFTTLATTLALTGYWWNRQKTGHEGTVPVAEPTTPAQGDRERNEQVRRMIIDSRSGTNSAVQFVGDANNPRAQANRTPPVDQEALLLQALAEARQSGTNEVRLGDRLHDLAEFLFRQQRFAHAEPVYRELLQVRQTYLPVNHRNVTGAAGSLGRVLSDWAWAEYHAQAANAVLSRASLPTTAPSAASKTPSLLPIGRAREAERILQEALAARIAVTNSPDRTVDDIWKVEDARSRLGGAVLTIAVIDSTLDVAARHSRFVEAEGLLLKSFARLQNLRLPVNQKYKGDALERLARLYEAWNTFTPNTGKAAKATEWKQKYDAFVASQSPRTPVGGTSKPVLSIPRRDPLTPSGLIDLTPHYNAALTSAWHFPAVAAPRHCAIYRKAYKSSAAFPSMCAALCNWPAPGLRTFPSILRRRRISMWELNAALSTFCTPLDDP